ncbi:hypothetical protein [Aquimarina sp. 2201CG5-10]|uniref:hypothetical protein n=1 Tax=Aquimarina callyspongiae TaxID=3098150 RepID=UPI002AB5633C|nr:hypothetical protein [Aquimarina sp. 2201CG5-10]MDY8135458.1 hypothetical protein [Aquimarina sp. 2201CG5-10]
MESIKKSPFNSAKSLESELKMQKKFRDLYINKLNEVQLKSPNNPIIINENYDFICMGCPADHISFFNNEVLITLNLNRKTMKYDEKKENKNIDDLILEGGIYSDIIEIYENLNSKKKWNVEPEKYGTEDCFDGGHTFYTVYYPNNQIESMYMRCWLPKEVRKEIK